MMCDFHIGARMQRASVLDAPSHGLQCQHGGTCIITVAAATAAATATNVAAAAAVAVRVAVVVAVAVAVAVVAAATFAFAATASAHLLICCHWSRCSIANVVTNIVSDS